MGLKIDLAPLKSIAEAQGLTPEMNLMWTSATEPTFPGAVLPVADDNGRLSFYAAADSQAEWRKLQPLLRAFAGPTLTNFDGWPRDLDPSKPFDAAMVSSGLEVVSVFKAGRFPNADRVVMRALLRLQDRIAAAPVLTNPRPKATSRLLAELQDALNVGDLRAASESLAVLRAELRLDAANLARLEMQILAAGGQWTAVRWHPRFETLVYGGPPPATANLLLEAIYRVQIADGDPVELDQKRAAIAPLVSNLLQRLPSPLNLTAQHLSEWLNPKGASHPQSLTTVPARAVEAEAEAEADDLGSPAPTALPTEKASAAPLDALPQSPIDLARSALMAVMSAPEGGDLAPATAAYDAVVDLDEADRADLLSRRVFMAIWEELQDRLGHRRPPANWTEWLNRLNDPDFDAPRLADAGNAWILGDVDLDPLEAQRMAQAVLDTPEGLAMDRLAEGMPFLVAWAQADARWPRPALRSVYIALLTAMAISGRSGEVLLKSASPLLDGALRSGLSAAEYREVLDAAGEIARSGLNRNSIYEILDLLETARASASADTTALETFTFSILNDLAAQATRLSAGQLLALSGLAEEAGWIHPLLTAPSKKAVSTAVDILSKIEVGIYTLTEGAARTARDLLLREHPGMRITLNHDHGGTSSLAALVQRADLFVIAWGSATHAATDFIRDRREKPIVYAAGKGASSIIKAIEEFAATSPE